MGVMQTYERTRMVQLFDGDAHVDAADEFNEVVRALVALAERDMAEEGFALDTVSLRLELDMNYGGQHHTVRLESPRLFLESAADVAAVCDSFNEVFAAAYGEGSIHPYGGILVQLFRLVAGAAGYQLESRPEPVAAPAGNGSTSGAASREVFWSGAGPLPTPVHDRAGVPDGFSTQGPALMEDLDTTVAVPPGWTYALDTHRTGWLTAPEANQ